MDELQAVFYITVESTSGKVRSYPDSKSALEHSISLYKQDNKHPGFALWQVDSGVQPTFLGVLRYDWERPNNFYWK